MVSKMRSDWFDRIKKDIASIFLSQPYVTSAITASVIILVLLVVLRENPPGPIESIIIISWTVLCINSLRAFSQMVGQAIEERRLLEPQERISYLKELTYIGIELFPIIVVFIISWIGIIDIYAAYKITIIIIMSLLFSYGFIVLRYRSKNVILCILGGIFFVLTALSLVFMRMIINWFRYTL